MIEDEVENTLPDNWLPDVLQDTRERTAQKPEWARSEYAQAELARLNAEAESRLGVERDICIPVAPRLVKTMRLVDLAGGESVTVEGPAIEVD